MNLFRSRSQLSSLWKGWKISLDTLLFSANLPELETVHLCKCKFSSDGNSIRTHNHLVRKRTLNHLATLAKWLSCVLSTYL